ncbi:hypothetical protein ACFSQ0_09815 [Mesonia sediminis]|uniref:Isoleucyl-tRNA synthetase n=1 Tax=Mesonia sediminis TaxID=1703946 RepID=A0ABW5SFJ6_9FLAO
MKTAIKLLFILMVSGLAAGLIMQQNEINEKLANVLIGSSLVLGIFIVMPLFLYQRSKSRSLKDYMLTPENIKKMKEKRVDDLKFYKKEENNLD